MHKGARFNSQTSVDEENPYWMSFSDLMSALLVIFILAAVALIIELTQKTNDVEAGIEELRKAELARKNIIYDVRDELAKRNVIVEIADNDTVIRIPERTLTFASGKDTIPDTQEVQKAVKDIGFVLHTAIQKNNRFQYLDTVFVEGHTDSDGIHYRGKGNWGLSVDRAISVWNVWQTEIELTPKLGDLENAFGQRLFSVSGYAETRRVNLAETTQTEKSKNRRIDIRFTVKKPSISDLERIVN
ncbi:OmpA family [Vibrio sp. B1FLJ16]|uniref:OmpA/MotB family protein n=1 Tax=Vibrio sp. B1FLJ16 TaxID=2751178 RepID=UPI0015F54E16|nr:OmpA family protein [Vibrio sp. B1FLJ16]CAD7807929.1 OmpA family [Vibrio sp. B1FLJ16]CAE6905823.1 OmpA family [Vibrio sp. B1FLJ16]